LIDHESAGPNQAALDHYQVGCPDVLAITALSLRAFKTQQMVGADGRIDLGEFGKPRVEGRTPPQIADLIADAVGVPRGHVRVQVADYRSRPLFLFGPSVGWQRSVPYQGQETVVEVLERVGALAPGTEPGEVYVVRAHIADGGRPEVYHIDLRDILVNRNETANLQLLPNDQIYIGDNPRERFERALPPWLSLAYRVVSDPQHK
jgi:protein involved in polysaccharide export with SLBB domain